MIVRRTKALFACVVAVAAASLGACATPTVHRVADMTPAPSEAEVAAMMAEAEFDPAIYSLQDDPNDPYRDVYAMFRARRDRDMQDPDLPPPVAPYPAVHLTRTQPWDDLSEILPFDAQVQSLPEYEDLERAIRVRLALDHPDIKIVQLLLGKGALLPMHAGGSPGVFIVVGGSGEITVEDETRIVTPGTTIKLNPYDRRRLAASNDDDLRLLWIRWAPNGDQAYIDAGYYLTGANAHQQPAQADMPMDYLFWDAVYETTPVPMPSKPIAFAPSGSAYAAAARALTLARNGLGPERDPYPAIPTFAHESAVGWLTAENLKKGGFFFSKDLSKMSAIADRMAEIARHKAVFRASRSDGRWDFNISETAWGPRSTYVEHSHLVPEFYYVMSGPVIYGVDGDRHAVMPGDIIVNNSYSPHLALGIVDGMPFDNFGSTWAPNGDRSVFRRPFFLLEPLPDQPDTARIDGNPSFH